jgi:hypothetical protein
MRWVPLSGATLSSSQFAQASLRNCGVLALRERTRDSAPVTDAA